MGTADADGSVPFKIAKQDPDLSCNLLFEMNLYEWFMDLIFPGSSDKWYGNLGNWYNFTPGVANYVPWRTFTLTHIDYPVGDLWAKMVAILSLTPLVIVIIHLTVIACQRDLHSLFYGLGTMVNLLTNYILKHSLKQPRPTRATNHLRDSTHLYQEYGMPSSHAQFMFFFSVYMTLFVKLRLGHCSKFWRNLWCLLCLGLAAVVAYGRIYLHYHTWSQVGWGSIVGAIVAFIWFGIVHKIMTPWFPLIASWPLFEWLQICDLTLIPNVMAFKYAVAKEAVAELQMEKGMEERIYDTSGDISADDEYSEEEYDKQY